MAKKKPGARSERAARAAAALAEQQHGERRRRNLLVGAVVVVLLLIVVGVFLGIQNSRDTSGATAKDVPRGVTDTYGVQVGKASAAKTVTVYEDFQCPICAQFDKSTYDQLEHAVVDGKIKLEYRMVSFLDQMSSTNYSTRALNAAAAVLDTTGKEAFIKYHHLLYANQPVEQSVGLTDDQLIDFAVQAGADRRKVSGPIKNQTFKQWTVNATDQMSKAGVTGTPTVFVNGKKQTEDGLQGSIGAALGALK